MIPIRDENPQLQTPLVTYVLIALNVVAWVLLQGLGTEPALSESVCRLGLIPGDLMATLGPGGVQGVPCRLDGVPDWSTLLSSMFLHGSWMHLIGNMWFLHIFGNNVEDSMGHLRFAVFYLLCGLAAATAQIASNLASPIPMVGASGAIGGVMGAYIVLYPRVHVHMLVVLGFYVTTFAVPAVFMLGYWMLVQFLGVAGGAGGVAFWAHIGGFAAGALLVWAFKNDRLLEQHPYRGWHQQAHRARSWHRVEPRGRRD